MAINDVAGERVYMWYMIFVVNSSVVSGLRTHT